MSRNLLILMGVAIAFVALSNFAMAEGVAVGSSSIITTLDYSDTFTASETRPEGVYPFTDAATAALVENTYGNLQVSWSLNAQAPANQPGFGSINSDSTYYGDTSWAGLPLMPYTGPSGVGSASGITQSGDSANGAFDFGMSYDLRDVFTVQFDTGMQPDYVSLTAGGVPGASSENDLSLAFRAGDAAGASIGLYNAAVGAEYNTGFSTGILTTDDDYLGWHNFGATFDLVNGLIDIYVDEDFKGQIDLHTVSGGAYWDQINETTNDYIRIGGAGTDSQRRIYWTDNFQVGVAEVPEPSTIVLLLSVFASLAFFHRVKK